MILKFSVTRTLFLECFILGLLFSCFGSVWWSLFYLRQVGEEANMEEKGPNTAASASASTAVCCVSDKKSSLSNSDSVVVVASSTTTSMKQQHSSTGDLLFPSKICMMGMIPHHHHHQGNNQDRQFGGGDVDGGGGGCVGPNRRNSSSGGGANEVVVSSTSSSSLYGRDENVVLISSTNLQQAFDIFSSYSYPTTYKPPGGGGMGGANVCGSGSGYPFTSAQWEELERQAMIYKYMISSVPVPPHLLFPLSPNFNPGGGGGGLAHHDPSGPSSPYNVRYSKNGGGGGDPEPGRCKRTDGKKWRCSRDVAPHHKYCERHLHRGRPRSRKPVELKNNNNNVADNLKKTRLDLEQKKPRPSSSISQHPVASNQQPLLLFDAKTDLTISSPPSYNGTTNRDLSLMTETEMAAMDGSVNRWQHLIEPDMGFANEGSSIDGSNSVDVFHQDYIEQQQPFDVFPYSVFCEPEIDPLIRFIDAWSSENLNNSSNGNAEPSVSPNHETLSPSLNLSMAMAVGDMLDREMGNIQTGSGVEYCDDAKDLRHSCSAWEPFARGGPLAEALGPNMGLGPASPHDSISNTATTVSSASEVIQRTLFSNSDGSVCNSPTTLAPSEFVLQWLS